MSTHCNSKELKILGDFWTLEIIQALSEGDKRFCQIERVLPDINPTTLTDRLKKLEKNKMIKNEQAYSLTEKGRGVLPVLIEMKNFAKKYL